MIRLLRPLNRKSREMADTENAGTRFKTERELAFLILARHF